MLMMRKRYMCMLFRPVWRLPLQGGHVHAWGDKYTHTHSLWWENIVSESTSYICYIFLYTLYHHEILSDPGVGPALEYSSLPSIVNLSCSVRQVINTNNNTMKVIIWKFANEQELWDLLQVFPEPRLSLSWYSEPDPSFPSYIDLWVPLIQSLSSTISLIYLHLSQNALNGHFHFSSVLFDPGHSHFFTDAPKSGHISRTSQPPPWGEVFSTMSR